MNKESYLDRFRADREAWEKLVSEVGEARMSQPGVMGEWTFKDLVAHLTGWRERTAMRVQAGCRIEAQNPPWWPHGVEGESDEDVERINTLIYEFNRARSAQDVLEDSERVLRLLEDSLQDLSEEAFSSQDCFAWTGGKPLIEIDLLDHWHTEHEPGVRTWLAQSQSAAKW